METLGWYCGRYGTLDEMTVPMNDRAHWFGDGAYDATSCHNYHIFAIDEHIDRFFNSASLLEIPVPMGKAELKDLLTDLVKKLDTGDIFVYFQVTRGGLTNRSHDYDETEPGHLWVMLKPAKVSDGKEPIRLITEEDRRFFFCNIKTLNLLPSVLASQHAKKAGAQEAVFWRRTPLGRRVTECAHSNCHIIRNNTLYTAPADELILPGIARAHLIRMCKKLGYPVSETPYYLDDLMSAQEILVTSSSNFCLHAESVDGRAVGGGAPEMLEDIRKHLVEEFYQATE
jgi:D-alanine transaminase